MSQIIYRHLFHLKNGKIDIQNKDLFKKNLNRFEGKDGFICLEKIEKTRSLEQNRYLWGVVVPIIQDEIEDFGGWDKESIYRWLEYWFLNRHTDENIHEWVQIKSLSTIDFETVLENIREWSSKEFGCYIPLPNEVELFGKIIYE